MRGADRRCWGVGARDNNPRDGAVWGVERLKKEASGPQGGSLVTQPRSSHPVIGGRRRSGGIWGCGPGKSNAKPRRPDPTAAQGPPARKAIAAPPRPLQSRLSPPPSRHSFPQPALARSASTSTTAVGASTSAPKLPQQLPRPQSETTNPTSNPVSNPIAKPAPKPKSKPKAKAIILRPSLPGTWRAATDEEAEALDLTGDGSGVRATSSSTTNPAKRAGSRSVWRTSGVEVLDLTGSQ